MSKQKYDPNVSKQLKKRTTNRKTAATKSTKSYNQL